MPGRSARACGLALLCAAGVANAQGGYQDGLRPFFSGDFKAAIKVWSPIAAQGDRRAQFFLGEIYAGGMGVATDPHKALVFYQLAAVQGLAAAQRRVGMGFLKGLGVPADRQQAFHWLSAAARNGDVEAQYQLAFLWERGIGTPTNPVEAFRWWSIGAWWGDPDASVERDRIGRKLTSAQRDAARRLVSESASRFESSDWERAQRAR